MIWPEESAHAASRCVCVQLGAHKRVSLSFLWSVQRTDVLSCAQADRWTCNTGNGLLRQCRLHSSLHCCLVDPSPGVPVRHSAGSWRCQSSDPCVAVMIRFVALHTAQQTVKRTFLHQVFGTFRPNSNHADLYGFFEAGARRRQRPAQRRVPVCPLCFAQQPGGPCPAGRSTWWPHHARRAPEQLRLGESEAVHLLSTVDDLLATENIKPSSSTHDLCGASGCSGVARTRGADTLIRSHNTSSAACCRARTRRASRG